MSESCLLFLSSGREGSPISAATLPGLRYRFQSGIAVCPSWWLVLNPDGFENGEVAIIMRKSIQRNCPDPKQLKAILSVPGH
jgi:hypothetical protein